MRRQSPGRRRNQDTRAVNTSQADLRENLTLAKTLVLVEDERGHGSRSVRPLMSLRLCLDLHQASSGSCQTENTRSWREAGLTSSRKSGASPGDPPALDHYLMASLELTWERAPSASSQWTAILDRRWRGQTDTWGRCLGGQYQVLQITIPPAPHILCWAAPVVTWPTSRLVSGLRPITRCPRLVTAVTPRALVTVVTPAPSPP